MNQRYESGEHGDFRDSEVPLSFYPKESGLEKLVREEKERLRNLQQDVADYWQAFVESEEEIKQAISWSETCRTTWEKAVNDLKNYETEQEK